ncbi:AAA family ATPase [Bradyrhizobium canariense]|uniref:UvrD-helicase domain-containing protein n=1 Tax=Bradyrhizobium canariense TaxID=255045 RepID=UPI001CA555BD|nr:UvrD-helicase domain-containing protein [Bradyrhizobium canariense]MBW5439738.1 AAA family ATPase [Bradyrhizobium canariense]
MVDLTKTQNEILGAAGPLLIRGGPGSRKTTIAILKAAQQSTVLRPAQCILFLSFARATVARIIETIEEEGVSPTAKQRIEVDTYHAFFWRILRTHGYLVGLPRRVTLVTPPNEAIALAAIRRKYKSNSKLSEDERKRRRQSEDVERIRLAQQEGRICFDVFAHFVGALVKGSKKIRSMIATAFPIIILDEFQDTTADQWSVLKAIGKHNTLIALADPEQRIFEFAGAEEKRLQQFRDTFHPNEFDLKSDNHRSKGTDIAKFGNDLLRGHFSQDRYVGIQFSGFEPNANQALATLRGHTLQARQRRLKAGKKNWTVAILVPTKRMTRQVSESLREPTAKMPSISHTAAVDMDGPILAAETIACLLQQEADTGLKDCIELLCAFYRGRDGDDPGKGNLAEADAIEKAYQKRKKGKAWPANSVVQAIRRTVDEVQSQLLSGDPDKDWIKLRTLLDECDCPRLREIAEEARSIRILERGQVLRQSLSQDWRAHGKYQNALAIVRQAFVQEHFATAGRPERGVIIMNMHKAKGKQFDEVIIFEGWPRLAGRKIVSNPDRIVRNNITSTNIGQDRQNLRVSVTRARFQTTILTPKGDPCVLLMNGKP